MTDREVTPGELERLDAEWDDLILGSPHRTPGTDAADLATIRSLQALAHTSPQLGRQVWSEASSYSRRIAHESRQTVASSRGRTMHLVAPAMSAWGWLPAGAIAVAASIAIFAGVLLGSNDGDGVSPTLPNADASSVVATLPSSAPAWATPGSMIAD
jgi:hypothetical protein